MLGMMTCPISVPLNEGPVKAKAGVQRVSRRVRGGSIFTEAICWRGSHRYAPAAYNSSRAPISGSASLIDSNGLPFSVPAGDFAGFSVGNSCLRNISCRSFSACRAENRSTRSRLRFLAPLR